MMGKFTNYLDKSKFTSPHFNPKHSNSQANGETTQTQNLIILKRQIRKNS